MPERLLKYYRPYRKTLFFALLGSVITSALDLCFPLFMRYILGDVLPEGNLFLLGQATIILLFLYLLNFIISYQVSRHGRLMGAKIEQDMRSDLFQHVQSMSFRYFDNIRIGQLISRIVSDIAEIRELVFLGPNYLLVCTITMLGTLGILIYLNWPLALLVNLLLLGKAYEERKGLKERDSLSKTKQLAESVDLFLKSHYDFRYNVLTEETEFRLLEQMNEGFQPVNQRVLNTICLEAHEAGIACWDRDLSRCIYSTRIAEYHPFRLYLDELPEWDGIDRVSALARRVSENPLWEKGFRIWMLGMTAQWMGVMGNHANSVAPLLISTEQGYFKSTFCKSLLPPVLRRYYMDKVDLTSQGNVERRLAEMGLLNLDEFDKFSPAKMPLLKNLMQMASLSLCKAYQKNYRVLPRIASFIGTSNRKDLLTDPTGSRRFICVEVEHPIDCEAIEHEQLYAQLKTAILSGQRYWFTKEEEQELQKSNLSFYRQGPVEDVLRACYRSAERREECDLLSAADIFQCLKRRNPAAMRGANPASLAQILVAVGIERKHTKFGNVYRVVKIG